MLRFCLSLYVFTQIYSISLLFRVTLGIAVASLTSAGRIPRTNTPNNHFHINTYQRHTDSEGSEFCSIDCKWGTCFQAGGLNNRSGLNPTVVFEDGRPLSDAHWHATVNHSLVAVKIKSLRSFSPASVCGHV